MTVAALKTKQNKTMPTGSEGSYLPVGNLRNRGRLGSLLPTGCIHISLLLPKCDLYTKLKKEDTPCEDSVGIVLYIQIDSERQTWRKGCGKRPFKE